MIQFEPQTDLAALIFEIETLTKEIGVSIVADVEANRNLTQEGVMFIMPKLAIILAKKETLESMYNNPKV